MSARCAEKGINVSIDEELYWELKKIAVDKRITLRSFIMDILRGYINGDFDCYTDKEATN